MDEAQTIVLFLTHTHRNIFILTHRDRVRTRMDEAEAVVILSDTHTLGGVVILSHTHR